MKEERNQRVDYEKQIFEQSLLISGFDEELAGQDDQIAELRRVIRASRTARASRITELESIFATYQGSNDEYNQLRDEVYRYLCFLDSYR